MAIKEVLTPFFPARTDGWGAFMAIPDQQSTYESQGQPGYATDTLFGLLGWMGKQGWNMKKVDEAIDISPIDKQYHDLVLGQKQDLEIKIKQGLGQAAVAVGDYELLLHDERKLREFMNYFEEAKKAEMEYEKAKGDEAKAEAERKLKNAEIHLKSIFIDQVDAHTGQSAMVQAVQRWPTIIVDFQSITKYDMAEGGENESANKIAERLGVSKAEGLVLAVKQRLYEEWKNLFRQNLTGRYERLKTLVTGRKKSIDEYREWLKPVISKHKMINEAFTSESSASSTNQVPFWTSGTATASHSIRTWAWKPLKNIEYYKITKQRKKGEFLVDPFDDAAVAIVFGGTTNVNDRDKPVKYKGWAVEFYDDKGTRKLRLKRDKDGNLVGVNRDKFDKKSLIEEYGLDAEMVYNEWWLGSIKKESIRHHDKPSDITDTNWGPMDPDAMYYLMMDIKLDKWVMRAPSWQSESATFNIKNNLLTSNMLLVKILETEADKWKFQEYVNEMLGLKADSLKIEEIIRKEYPHLYNVKPSEKSKSKEGGSKTSIIDDMRMVFVSPIRDLASSLSSSSQSFLKKFGISLEGAMFRSGRGPYEAVFKDRMTSYFLKAAGGEWAAVSGKLKSMMGM